MKGAAFVGPGELEVQEFPDPAAGSGGLVIKIGSNTICGTDGRILRGEKTKGIRPGCVLGHEIAGEVVEVGKEVTDFQVGDHIGVLPTVPCGRCYYCIRGWEHLCIDSRIFGYVLDGGMADYMAVPDFALQRGGIYRVDPAVPLTSVSLAEPLGCVINGADQYQVHVDETVVVIGAGPIGLLHMKLAKLAGARVIISETNPYRREVAVQEGADLTVDPTAVNLAEFIKEETAGVGADVVVIAIGIPGLINQGLQCLRKRGRLSAFAGFPKDADAVLDPNLIHYSEITVFGASNAGRDDHGRAIKLIESGRIDVSRMVTHTYGLDQIHEAIKFVSSGEGIKVAITP